MVAKASFVNSLVSPLSVFSVC